MFVCMTVQLKGIKGSYFYGTHEHSYIQRYYPSALSRRYTKNCARWLICVFYQLLLLRLMHLLMVAPGEATGAAGGSRVGGISARRKREGNGSCTREARAVTEVSCSDVNSVNLLYNVLSTLFIPSAVCK